MRPFRWLATFWTPAIDYRDYPANEVEDIAWDATTIGSARGFLVGFLACILVIALLAVGAVMTGLDRRSAPPPAPTQGQQDAAALQAVRQELNTLRDENEVLKKQVIDAKAAAACPPCQPQAVAKDQPQSRPVAPPPPPSKQAMPRAPAERKASGLGPADRVPRPIPSNCRQPGDCE